jgi:hypothetical protein
VVAAVVRSQALGRKGQEGLAAEGLAGRAMQDQTVRPELAVVAVAVVILKGFGHTKVGTADPVWLLSVTG